MTIRGFARGRIRQEAWNLRHLLEECGWQPEAAAQDAIRKHAACLRGHIASAELAEARAGDLVRAVDNLLQGKHSCARPALRWACDNL